MEDEDGDDLIEFGIEEFEPSHITVIEGSSIVLSILFRLCVDSIISLNRDVLYIDGYNTFDPYIIQRMVKPLRIDQRKILSRIHIARAFTEYQMETLIRGLNATIKEWNAGVLIISYLPNLFYRSKNNPNKYSKKLFESSIEQLRFTTTSSNVITVITSFGDFCFEDKLLASKADRIIHIKKTKNIIRIVDDGNVSEHVPVVSGQTRFSDF